MKRLRDKSIFILKLLQYFFAFGEKYFLSWPPQLGILTINHWKGANYGVKYGANYGANYGAKNGVKYGAKYGRPWLSHHEATVLDTCHSIFQ